MWCVSLVLLVTTNLYCSYAYFIDEETEAWRDQLTCLRHIAGKWWYWA